MILSLSFTARYSKDVCRRYRSVCTLHRARIAVRSTQLASPGPFFCSRRRKIGRPPIVSDFIQERHKPPTPLDRPRELFVACPPMRSNVNLSHIVRAAGCGGVQHMVCCGNAKVIGKIARDASEAVEIEFHRTLPPVLKRLREEGYQIVGLEQTNNSTSIFEFSFTRKTVLVVGNERSGIDEEALRLVDQVVEIPVYGRPYAHDAATAAIMALYEYCRQYPKG